MAAFIAELIFGAIVGLIICVIYHSFFAGDHRLKRRENTLTFCKYLFGVLFIVFWQKASNASEEDYSGVIQLTMIFANLTILFALYPKIKRESGKYKINY